MPAEIARRDTKLERREAQRALAQDILEECRVQLMLKFRFLDMALWRLEMEPLYAEMRYALSTDARTVYYEPMRVIGRFSDSYDECVRDYLHLVLHCIFRHPFDKDHPDKEAWSLTCDIVAESVAMDMCGDRLKSFDDQARRSALGEIKLITGSLVPHKIYNMLHKAMSTPEGSETITLNAGRINEFRRLFERDNHEGWPANVTSDETITDPNAEGDNEASEGDENEDVVTSDTRLESSADQEPDDSTQEDNDDSDEGEDRDSDDADQETLSDDAEEAGDEADDEDSKPEDQMLERDWEELAKQIEMDLETFAKEWGEEAGSFIASLKIVNRKTTDYTDFLRRFMTLSEEMKINDDDFDYVFYTYGLRLYGNMPLVEPLEYKEVQRIRDFCIVIDTSESVSGGLVRRFLEHTFTILKEGESFGRDVNIHILQADAKVQVDSKITDLSEVEALCENFMLRGFGGTDFRPAFAYVDQLRKRGELPDMKGLIYFTDGLGTFPDETPDYDAAFVFMDDGEHEPPAVPPWAIKVLIDEVSLNRLKA